MINMQSHTVKMDEFYHCVDRIPGSAAAVMQLAGAYYAAKWTGEFRAPKKGEWYLSGAIVGAYLAPNDMKREFHIAKIVRVRKVQYWEEV